MGSRHNLVDFVSRARKKYSNIGPMTSVNRDSFHVGRRKSRISCLSLVGLGSGRDILVNDPRERMRGFHCDAPHTQGSCEAK
jgi:hypothetical protein